MLLDFYNFGFSSQNNTLNQIYLIVRSVKFSHRVELINKVAPNSYFKIASTESAKKSTNSGLYLAVLLQIGINVETDKY